MEKFRGDAHKGGLQKQDETVDVASNLKRTQLETLERASLTCAII